MIRNGEQCYVCPSPSPITGSALFTSDEIDEGYNSSDGSRRSSGSEATAHFGGLKYRRSGDLATTRACVSKNIRIRKPKGKRSSAGTR
ncbi:hypothetical protein LTR04_002583 [Oleoguttula sp. CCFEE 6159]|nr:hypothetical protein LTR04_002583 [Oleoguttula sp. CCFEE 6159]